MSKIERVIKVVDWLIFEKIIESRRDLAVKLDYTESSLSQILNEKVNLSDKFIKKLSNLDSRLSYEWILNESGTMTIDENLNDDDSISNVVKEPEENYGKSQFIPMEIYKLTLENEKLSKKKELELIRQNGELLDMIKKLLNK